MHFIETSETDNDGAVQDVTMLPLCKSTKHQPTGGQDYSIDT